MKKKLTIYYTILIAAIIIPIAFLISTIFNLANTKMDVLSESDFIAKAELLNTKVSNMKIVISDSETNGNKDIADNFIKTHIKKSLNAKNDNLDLKYIKCDDSKMAYSVYLHQYNINFTPKQEESKKANNEQKYSSTYNGKNFNYQEVRTNFGNYVFLRVEDTYLGIFSYDNDVFKQAKEVFGFSDLDISNGNMVKLFVRIYLLSWLYILFFYLFASIPMAYIFKKANIHPLIAFIPFCNKYFLCKIADNEGWKMVFFYIPVVQIVYNVIISLRLAKVFNKSELFGVGIFFAPLILLPIIAFDNSEYIADFDNTK